MLCGVPLPCVPPSDQYVRDTSSCQWPVPKYCLAVWLSPVSISTSSTFVSSSSIFAEACLEGIRVKTVPLNSIAQNSDHQGWFGSLSSRFRACQRPLSLDSVFDSLPVTVRAPPWVAITVRDTTSCCTGSPVRSKASFGRSSSISGNGLDSCSRGLGHFCMNSDDRTRV